MQIFLALRVFRKVNIRIINYYYIIKKNVCLKKFKNVNKYTM